MNGCPRCLLLRRLLLVSALAGVLLASELAGGVELYGVRLAQAGRAELRAAVEGAGAVLEPQEGAAVGYDVYRSESVLKGTRAMFLGFRSDNGGFAFLEYLIDSHLLERYRALLSDKYGAPQTVPGKFLRDTVYSWRQAPIEIRLYLDWPAARVRLSYTHEANLAALKRERAESAGAGESAYY